MKAAASSWWTSTKRIRSWWRRSPSMIPLMPSPGRPNTVSTPQSASRSASRSVAICFTVTLLVVMPDPSCGDEAWLPPAAQGKRSRLRCPSAAHTGVANDVRGMSPSDRKGPLMGILGWIVLGLIAGAIAKALVPGRDPGGLILTTVIGILGALLGGFLGQAMLGRNTLDNFFDVSTWFTAIIGSIILLVLWRGVGSPRGGRGGGGGPGPPPPPPGGGGSPAPPPP